MRPTRLRLRYWLCPRRWATDLGSTPSLPMDDLEILRDAMLTIGIPPDRMKRTARGSVYPFCDWPLSVKEHRCLSIEWVPRSRPYLDSSGYWVNALVCSSTEYAIKEHWKEIREQLEVNDLPPVLWLGPFAPWPHKCRSMAGLQIAALASIYLPPRDPTIHLWDGSKVTLKRIVGERAWYRSDMVACPYCLSMLFPPEGYQ